MRSEVECSQDAKVGISKSVWYMSVETTAALYGAISGAIATGIVTGIISVAQHFLKRKRGIEFIPSNWRFAYLIILNDPIHEKPEYRLYEPSYPYEYEGEPYEAIYAFTVDLINNMDVADTLRDVSVAFMRNGETMFTHRPFDEDNTTDRTPIVFELPPYRSTSYDLVQDPSLTRGSPTRYYGIESIGVITLPAHDSRRIRLKGYLIDNSHPGFEDKTIQHLKSGCDEVRLRAKRENGKPFDAQIARLDTAPHST
jgi:hypothetical protein